MTLLGYFGVSSLYTIIKRILWFRRGGK
jgi:hypothetical protein